MEPAAAVAARPPANGGFPEPWRGEPMQLVRCRHRDCREATLIRIPADLPPRAVRLVVCGSCQQSFEADAVEEVGLLAHARRRPQPPARPRRPRRSLLEGRAALLAIPVALAAVIGALLLIEGSGGSTSASSSNAGAKATGAKSTGATPAPPAATSKPSRTAQLVRGSSYTLALPAGWVRTAPAGGSTFAARAADGSADATLWISREPKLDFPTFEAKSLAQLRALAGSAHVADRVTAPTAEGTIVRLAADAPLGKPGYDVTLRVAGPYRYYLATTVEPNASPRAAKDVALLENSLTPTAAGKAAGR